MQQQQGPPESLHKTFAVQFKHEPDGLSLPGIPITLPRSCTIWSLIAKKTSWAIPKNCSREADLVAMRASACLLCLSLSHREYTDTASIALWISSHPLTSLSWQSGHPSAGLWGENPWFHWSASAAKNAISVMWCRLWVLKGKLPWAVNSICQNVTSVWY